MIERIEKDEGRKSSAQSRTAFGQTSADFSRTPHIISAILTNSNTKKKKKSVSRNMGMKRGRN